MRHGFVAPAFALAYTIGAQSACSSAPSVSEAEKHLAEAVETQSQSRITLVDFRKTNGQQGQLMGIKVYALEYDAEIEFRQDCWWGSPLSGFGCQPGDPGPFDSFLYMGKQKARKGDRQRVTGTITFEMTERGWRPSGVPSPSTHSVSESGQATGSAETWKARVAPQQAQPQARGELSGDERPYVAAMKSDLRNLVTVEEAYFLDHGAYTASLPANMFALSTGVIGPQITLTGNGYTAKVGHKLSGQTCVIFIGSTPFPPATREGEPQCQPQAPATAPSPVSASSSLDRSSAPASIYLPGRSLRGLAYDSGVLWAVHSQEGGDGDVVRISSIDPQTGRTLHESSDFDWNGRGITVGAGSLWIVDARADAVHRVDPSSLSEVSSFRTPGTEPTALAFDGTHLWLIDPYFRNTYQLSTGGAVLASFAIPNAFRSGLEWENGGLWMNTGRDELTRYAPSGAADTTKTLQGFPGDIQIGDLALGARKIYVCAGSRIYILDW